MTRMPQNIAFKDETVSEKTHIFLRLDQYNVLVILWRVDRDFLDSVKVDGIMIGEISSAS